LATPEKSYVDFKANYLLQVTSTRWLETELKIKFVILKNPQISNFTKKFQVVRESILKKIL